MKRARLGFLATAAVLILGGAGWWLVTIYCFNPPHVFSPLFGTILFAAFTEWALGNPILSKRRGGRNRPN